MSPRIRAIRTQDTTHQRCVTYHHLQANMRSWGTVFYTEALRDGHGNSTWIGDSAVQLGTCEAVKDSTRAKVTAKVPIWNPQPISNRTMPRSPSRSPSAVFSNRPQFRCRFLAGHRYALGLWYILNSKLLWPLVGIHSPTDPYIAEHVLHSIASLACPETGDELITHRWPINLDYLTPIPENPSMMTSPSDSPAQHPHMATLLIRHLSSTPCLC
ncbi:hypothetical protein V8F06_001588 [Rhypophila decipiens]